MSEANLGATAPSGAAPKQVRPSIQFLLRRNYSGSLHVRGKAEAPSEAFAEQKTAVRQEK